MFLLLKLKIESVGASAIQVQIEGEDYSLADVVHRELLETKHVKFAGVAPPHPLIKTLTIRIHTDGSDANRALTEAIRVCQKKVSEILEVATRTFPDALKPPRPKEEKTEDPSRTEASPQV